MSSAQEAAALARRRAIHEVLHPETKHVGNRKGEQVRHHHDRRGSGIGAGGGVGTVERR
jgi:hypothetical protein